jgi:hypothetical protein
VPIYSAQLFSVHAPTLGAWTHLVDVPPATIWVLRDLEQLASYSPASFLLATSAAGTPFVGWVIAPNLASSGIYVGRSSLYVVLAAPTSLYYYATGGSVELSGHGYSFAA